MADLKKLIGNAMNRATSSYGDPKKKSKDKTAKPEAKMPTRGPSLLQSKRTDNNLSSLPYSAPAAAPAAVKTAKDYRKERRAVNQQYKNERNEVKQGNKTDVIIAKNDRKIKQIESGKKTDVAGAVVKGTEAATGLLGLATGITQLVKNKKGN